MSNICIFCDSVIDAQEILRTNLIKVIYPQRPVVEMAVMIMPIRHCENVHELSQDESIELFEMIGKLQVVFKNIYGCEGYNLFVNNGLAAGQHVPHTHFHLFGRATNEKLSPFAVLNSKELYQSLEKLSPEEIRSRAERIKAEYDSI